MSAKLWLRSRHLRAAGGARPRAAFQCSFSRWHRFSTCACTGGTPVLLISNLWFSDKDFACNMLILLRNHSIFSVWFRPLGRDVPPGFSWFLKNRGFMSGCYEKFIACRGRRPRLPAMDSRGRLSLHQKRLFMLCGWAAGPCPTVLKGFLWGRGFPRTGSPRYRGCGPIPAPSALPQ